MSRFACLGVRVSVSASVQGNFPFSFQDYNTDDLYYGGQWRTHWGALASNIVGVLCWITIAWLFYRNKFFYNL